MDSPSKSAKAIEQIDVTLPGSSIRFGSVHPITQTIRRVSSIMSNLGFEVVDGPEVEDQWHNFEALAIPDEHPARDPLDNFYINVANFDRPVLLRSQTSTVQIRVMEHRKPPLRIVSLGRVYRPDTADSTHYPMFHQVEGLLIEPGTTMAHLKSVLRSFASSFLGGDVRVRFRPSFFPFTEPSVEVDMEWNGRWIEMGGAGMVDPSVLQAVGYDPDEVCGFAFGLGVERIAARRFGVADIRDFYRNDIRFLEQFHDRGQA
jgi:phenylalanyl-tRNA synthetase alpha chain